jgi:hypothetical protein
MIIKRDKSHSTTTLDKVITPIESANEYIEHTQYVGSATKRPRKKIGYIIEILKNSCLSKKNK